MYIIYPKNWQFSNFNAGRMDLDQLAASDPIGAFLIYYNSCQFSIPVAFTHHKLEVMLLSQKRVVCIYMIPILSNLLLEFD